MKSFLVSIRPIEDVDFLNACEIPFDFMDRLGKSDSGWCDVDSGAVILMDKEIIKFTVDNTEDEVLLKLKFTDRIKEYISKD